MNFKLKEFSIERKFVVFFFFICFSVDYFFFCLLFCVSFLVTDELCWGSKPKRKIEKFDFADSF